MAALRSAIEEIIYNALLDSDGTFIFIVILSSSRVVSGLRLSLLLAAGESAMADGERLRPWAMAEDRQLLATGR